MILRRHFFAALVCAAAIVSCQKEQLQSARPVANSTTGLTNSAGASNISYNALTGTYTLTLQPGPKDGDDFWMKNWIGHPAYANTNDSKVGLIKGLSYNLGGTLVNTRSVLKFDSLIKIPPTAKVTKAVLYLYGPAPGSKDVSVHLPMGNTAYPGSTKGDNTCLLQSITSKWNINSICWNNPPVATTTNQVIVGPSTKQWQWDVALNVTSLIRPMIIKPEDNQGLLLKLKTEQKPRALGFLSSNSPEVSRRPKLVVSYTLQ